MAQAARDSNRIPTLLCVSNVDGTTPVPVKVSSSDHGILYADGSTGSDVGGGVAVRDDNRVTSLIGVSSADGVTPVFAYADPTTGELLVQIT